MLEAEAVWKPMPHRGHDQVIYSPLRASFDLIVCVPLRIEWLARNPALVVLTGLSMVHFDLDVIVVQWIEVRLFFKWQVWIYPKDQVERLIEGLKVNLQLTGLCFSQQLIPHI